MSDGIAMITVLLRYDRQSCVNMPVGTGELDAPAGASDSEWVTITRLGPA